MRQFSIIQDIPLDVEFSKALHDINLQGKQSNIWGFRHHEHILYWSHRQELVIRVGANVSNGVVEGYDTWYTYITRRFHTRIGGSHFYSIDLLDHMDAIARGEIDGTNEDIAFLCAHGKNVVKGAFSHGVFQDFPVEDRREKENLKRLKPKKVYHKGGRGGTNAPCNLGIAVSPGSYSTANSGTPATTFSDATFCTGTPATKAYSAGAVGSFNTVSSTTTGHSTCSTCSAPTSTCNVAVPACTSATYSASEAAITSCSPWYSDTSPHLCCGYQLPTTYFSATIFSLDAHSVALQPPPYVVHQSPPPSVQSLIDQCVIFRILITNGIQRISGLIRRSFQLARIPLFSDPVPPPPRTPSPTTQQHPSLV
ncbi:hypothetical protein AgCh_012833 [Apium graveolens]